MVEVRGRGRQRKGNYPQHQGRGCNTNGRNRLVGDRGGPLNFVVAGGHDLRDRPRNLKDEEWGLPSRSTARTPASDGWKLGERRSACGRPVSTGSVARAPTTWALCTSLSTNTCLGVSSPGATSRLGAKACSALQYASRRGARPGHATARPADTSPAGPSPATPRRKARPYRPSQPSRAVVRNQAPTDPM